MSGFQPIDFPQVIGRLGGRGADGAPGAAGPPGPNGATGAVSIVTRDLSLAELQGMNVTPIIISADADGFIQLPVYGFYEFSKTVGSGGPNPTLRVRWRGTTTDALPATTVTLGTAEISYRFVVGAALNNQSASGSPSIRIPIEGLGLQCDFSLNPGAAFRATARVNLAMLTIPAVFS